jgi:hypothetical protein
MVNVALLIGLEAKPGKEDEVASFLREGLPLVQEEPATTVWFGIRMGPSTFGILCFPGRIRPASTPVWSRRCSTDSESIRAFRPSTHNRERRCPCSQAP